MRYYKRAVDSTIEIYRTRPSQRFIMCTLGGYFPVLQKLADGRLAAVLRAGDLHVGERGTLGIVYSPDGGESWSGFQEIAGEGPDDRNPAFGQSSAGTLIVTYMKQIHYANGEWQREGPFQAPDPFYLRRSTDGGQSWSREEAVYPIQNALVASPYGKIIELPDRTLLMTFYAATTDDAKRTTAWITRSRDDGKTWGDLSAIAAGYNETALCYLPSGKLLAMLRGTPADNISQAESVDGGYTWSAPRVVTGERQHPGDLICLRSGRLLLTFGHRRPPYGVRALVSSDEGATWNLEQTITLAAESLRTDCGYPSSVQRADGKIFTAYYAYESNGPWKMWRAEVPIGPHAAGVLYDEQDLP